MVAANNLSELTDDAVARTNLGLGTAAVAATTDFDAMGAAAAVAGTSLQKNANLADLTDAAAARTNLGVSTSGSSLQVVNNLSDVNDVPTAAVNIGVPRQRFEPTLSHWFNGSKVGKKLIFSGDSTTIQLISHKKLSSMETREPIKE